MEKRIIESRNFSDGRYNKLDDESINFVIILIEASPIISVIEMSATLQAQS